MLPLERASSIDPTLNRRVPVAGVGSLVRVGGLGGLLFADVGVNGDQGSCCEGLRCGNLAAMSDDAMASSQSVGASPRPLVPPLAPGVDWTADDPGPLWTGSVTVGSSDRPATGEGCLTRIWLPSPVLQLSVTTDEDWARAYPSFNPESLAVDDGELTDWHPTRLSGPAKPVSRTFMVTDMVLGDRTVDCAAVRFAVVNFPKFIGLSLEDDTSIRAGRLELDVGRWHIRLDAVDVPDLHNQMSTAGRVFAVTHVGLVTTRDGEAISYSCAEEILRAFSLWASLLRGAYTSPVVMVGEAADASSIWTRHVDWHLDSWSAASGILPRPLLLQDRPETLPALARSLSRVVELLADPEWGDVLRRVAQWYLTANVGQTEGDLVLAQVGLELLAYATIVLGGHLTSDGFSRLTAADHFQLLLAIHSLPLTVPPDLVRLGGYARGRQIDAPRVVAEFRNRIVHPPTKKNRPAEFDDVNARIEAKTLSLHLLERAILATLGYDGVVHDRPSGAEISLHLQRGST